MPAHRSIRSLHSATTALFVAVAATMPAAQIAAQEGDGRTLFEDVTVIAPSSGEARAGLWVGVERGRFAVISEREPSGWSDARHIDGRGLFLVPGLIDMHVHPGGLEDLMALVAHGVTSIRVGMGTPTYLRWREGVASGSIVGPNLVVGSPWVWDRGPDGMGILTPDAEGVRAVVRRLHDQGYDFIKIVDVYDHEVAEALFDEAARLEIPVFGHVADDATVPLPWEWTASLGYRTLEHLDEVVLLAMPDGATDDELQAFVDTARRHGVAFTSLLEKAFARARAYARAADGLPAYSEEEEARAFVVSGPNGRRQLRTFSQGLAERSREELSAEVPDTGLVMRAFARLVEAGVPIVPGTEGSSPTEWAGATLHDELEVFGRGGLTPIEVLRAATADAARLLGAEGITGGIQEGGFADAVLVAADPRHGVDALRTPIGVMVRGRWYGPAELARMRELFGVTDEDTDRKFKGPFTAGDEVGRGRGDEGRATETSGQGPLRAPQWGGGAARSQ